MVRSPRRQSGTLYLRKPIRARQHAPASPNLTDCCRTNRSSNARNLPQNFLMNGSWQAPEWRTEQVRDRAGNFRGPPTDSLKDSHSFVQPPTRTAISYKISVMANDCRRRMAAHDLQQFDPSFFASDPRFVSVMEPVTR
jgi:hypothetical protein